MKKIGFIDYYLDEWHANYYPEMIKNQSNGRYEVCYAYGKIDSLNGGITNKEWAIRHNVELCGSIEEVIKKSDLLVVLSPDNPEMHLELSDLPLKSGKLVYIDKTFAPDKETAVKIFENAKAHSTKCYSSSALRFSPELDDIETNRIYKIYSEGPGTYEVYSVHQIEPIVRLMNSRAKRVMALDDTEHPSLVIEFADRRKVQMYHRFDSQGSFRITVCDRDNNAKIYTIESDYFKYFIDAMIKFFDTGVVPVPNEQTIDIMAIREAGFKAAENPYTWIEL